MTYTALCEGLTLEFLGHLVREGVAAYQESGEAQKDVLEAHGCYGSVGWYWVV